MKLLASSVAGAASCLPTSSPRDSCASLMSSRSASGKLQHAWLHCYIGFGCMPLHHLSAVRALLCATCVEAVEGHDELCAVLSDSCISWDE